MNNKRKQIIMSEITYWKHSKLLPEHYCDFLITLYAQGEEKDKETIVSESIIVKEKKKLTRMIISLSLLAIIVSSGMFVFTTYPLVTLGLSNLVLLFFLLFAVRGNVTKLKITPLLYILSAFMLLAISMKIWITFFPENTIVLIVLLAINCFFWLFAGKYLKYYYFIISGVAGLLVISGFVVSFL